MAGDTKTCTKCREVKPLTEFDYKGQRQVERRARCRVCAEKYGVRGGGGFDGPIGTRREYHQRWYRKHKQKILANCKTYRLGKKFGITPERLEEMKQEQNGKCALCEKVSELALHVDHDHATGKVRALLCGTCNQMLGMAYDQPALLRKAADYLEGHATSQ